jgi:hypothetical protein
MTASPPSQVRSHVEGESEVSETTGRRRRGRLWWLGQMRWAIGATVLFAAGGAAELAGAPPALSWGFYGSCHTAAG